MHNRVSILIASIGIFAVAGGVHAVEQVLTAKLHHLRAAKDPEWSDFPRDSEGADLKLRFHSRPNLGEWSLRLRQQDVRLTWKVLLNGKELGRLPPDENDQVIYFRVPAGSILDGENTLTIEQVGKAADDVRIGEIALDDRPVANVLAEATVEIRVVDGAAKDKPLPCRITIVNAKGALATTSARSGEHLAVRPGVIYTGNGNAKFGLPAGDYTIYAGRGFAYGIDSVRISVKRGDEISKVLTIRREVPTPGFVSCDTHVHTFTFSGHGDSSDSERVLTIAGEGIELPIATDHNVQIDHDAMARKLGVRKYFTPVVGNEVTTTIGHFNVFPLKAGGPVPDFKLKDWPSIFASIEGTEGARPKVVILNHPRDLHSNFRPFGPARHLALIGEDLEGWALRANALELVNSGAHQSDMMRPVRDWFGLLNRGLNITPVGASDSHDVSRYIVGQGRTYIRCKDGDPGAIDVKEAVDNFLQGRVNVSCGLLAEITVNGKYGPGDLVPASDELKVAVRVLGPSWVTADKVELYANGLKIKEAIIPVEPKAGVKWENTWRLPRFRHDVHLVAVASGPGVTELYWPISKPYQPTSPVVNRRVIGITGAVWIDGDGDGKKTSADEYARKLHDMAGGKVPKLIQSLAGYDEAVASQAAGLLQANKISANDPDVREAAKKAGTQVERGFQAFAEAWRESQIARAVAKEKK